MRIIFLPSAATDIAWFRYYYRSIFPAGEKRAQQQLKAISRLLAANPYLGQPVPDRDPIRELPIQNTPFVMIYQVTTVQIEVLRLWDGRQGANY